MKILSILIVCCGMLLAPAIATAATPKPYLYDVIAFYHTTPKPGNASIWIDAKNMTSARICFYKPGKSPECKNSRRSYDGAQIADFTAPKAFGCGWTVSVGFVVKGPGGSISGHRFPKTLCS